MHLVVFALAIIGCLAGAPHAAMAQSSASRFELGAQVTATKSNEFDSTDVGFGMRFSWHPLELLGIEAEFDLYPGDFPDPNAFSSSRTEGLFGATVGPRFGRVRPFAKLRPGFVVFGEAPGPIVCIAIFPPPLSCTLAAGRTLLAVDIGGGVEMFASPKIFVRLDVGDRVLKYPGPSFDRRRTRREDAFFSHDIRFAVGGGLRF